MTDRSSRANLALKPRDCFTLLQHLVAEDVRANSLDGDAASNQILIARQVNLAHRAPAQALLQQIT